MNIITKDLKPSATFIERLAKIYFKRDYPGGTDFKPYAERYTQYASAQIQIMVEAGLIIVEL